MLFKSEETKDVYHSITTIITITTTIIILITIITITNTFTVITTTNIITMTYFFEILELFIPLLPSILLLLSLLLLITSTITNFTVSFSIITYICPSLSTNIRNKQNKKIRIINKYFSENKNFLIH